MDLSFLEKVPLYLRKGPWVAEAWATVLAFGGYLLYTHFDTDSCSYRPDALPHAVLSAASLQGLRLFGGLYMLGFTAFFLRATGPWPLISYTMLSWNLLTLRLLAAYAAASDPAASSSSLVAGARAVAAWVKFPALVMNSITVVVWWSLLTPAISYLMRDTPKAAAGFRKFNRSVPLLHIHAANLPVAALEFLATGVRLKYADLHAAFCIGFVYVLFYLLVLDARGVQIYIVFSPRTRWCVVTFSLIPLLYWGAFNAWNAALEKV
jgi:hypothetical protein